jgi:hypothetical protein
MNVIFKKQCANHAVRQERRVVKEMSEVELSRYQDTLRSQVQSPEMAVLHSSTKHIWAMAVRVKLVEKNYF